MSNKVFLEPKDFQDLLSFEQLKDIMEHQRHAFETDTLQSQPFPETKDEELLQTYQSLSENREPYEGEIGAAIDADDIIKALRPNNMRALTDERARLIRIRSSVVAAHKVLMKNQVTIVPDQPGVRDKTSEQSDVA